MIRAALALSLSLTLPGCGLLISAVRGAVSPTGGPIEESAHVSGSTSGSAARLPMDCGGASRSPQHVYRFVAPRSAEYTFESSTSDYDGVIAVFDTSGAELACNDDYQSTRSSQVVVSLSEGQAVDVAQGGYSGASGRYELWITGGGVASPSTVTLADGTVVEAHTAPPQPLSLGVMVTGDTRGLAAIEGLACPPTSPMQEWTFVAPTDGSFLFQVDAQYDAYLGVLSAADGSALGCNDDWNGTAHARVATELVAGETYRVVVGGYSRQAGAYSLTSAQLATGGALTASQPVLFVAGNTDSEPDVCGAPAGSVDRTFTFTPRTEAFYAFYADVSGWLVIGDGRRVVACMQVSPDRRVGLLLKARHRYSIVLELGAPDGAAHTLSVDRVDPSAPDWQLPPQPLLVPLPQTQDPQSPDLPAQPDTADLI